MLAVTTERSRVYLAAFVTAASASFLLGGYEFVRSASNTLFKAAYGSGNLPTVLALVPLMVVLTLYLYGKLLSRFGPRKTLLYTSLGSGALLLACYVAIDQGSRLATAGVYLIREAYVVLLIEQYWSFLNSTLKENNAKKLNGAITGIASLGAIAGGWMVHWLSEPLGTNQMLLFGAASLIPTAILSDLAYAKCGEPQPELGKTLRTKGDPLKLSQFTTSPLLALLLGLILITQVVSAVLGIHFQTILQEVIPNADAQTAYSGKFYANVNALSALFQFVLAPFLLSRVPLVWIHAVIPLVHLATCFVALTSPTLFSVGLSFTLFKTFDYSIFRAAKEILYIPLSFDVRFRAKEVIDVFGYRFGKGGASLSLIALQRMGIAYHHFLIWIAIGASAVWVAIVYFIGLLRKPPDAELQQPQAART